MTTQRIAINCGGGYAPGLNGVVTGAALAAQELGWEVVGIHDGYDGLLFPDYCIFWRASRRRAPSLAGRIDSPTGRKGERP